MLAAGEYRNGLPLHNLAGEPDRPITITGPADGPPATFVANAERNTVSIVDSHHVVVKNLVLDGRDIPVDAVKAEGHARYAHHITLENLVIRGHGNNQQTVGISTKCPAWNWVIRGNTIVSAGTGMYFGDSDGSAPSVAGVIEGNLIVDTIGYNLQIKHQHRRPEIDGLPAEGANVTVIRRNVFANAAGGSTQAPRPNVLVGHFPPKDPASTTATSSMATSSMQTGSRPSSRPREASLSTTTCSSILTATRSTSSRTTTSRSGSTSRSIRRWPNGSASRC